MAGTQLSRSAAVLLLVLAVSEPCFGGVLNSWGAPLPQPLDARSPWAQGRTHLAKAKEVVASTAVFPPFDPAGFISGFKELLTGGIAGGIGSFIVFPIDLAKTRIQDQRAVAAGAEVVYKNVIQTIGKVATTEGFPSLYKGVTPVLIGAMPEGALQIGVNNIVRQTFADSLGTTEDKIPLAQEIIAGACGGAAQVVVSNPMERVKILQQVMGKQASTVTQIVKQVGLRGLYTGWRPCLGRDLFFGAIYFPVYNNVKKKLTVTDKPGVYREATVLDALAAGLIAGIAAAGTTCPFDVVKTRMQSAGAAGHSSTVSLRAATGELWVEGGARAFFKGFTGRVGRVAPQLAICLAIVEAIKRIPGFEPAAA